MCVHIYIYDIWSWLWICMIMTSDLLLFHVVSSWILMGLLFSFELPWNPEIHDEMTDAWTLLGSLNVNHIVCRVFEISKVPGCFFGTEQVPQQLAARAKLLKCWHSWHSSPKCQGHCWALWLYMPWGSPSAASAQTVTWQHSMQLACVMWGGGV